MGRLQTMRMLYKPFAIIAGVVGARLGKRAFRGVWSRIDDREPPDATAAEASLPKVVGAAALEAATMAAIAAAVDRASARTFHYLTGIWPEKKKEKKGEKS
jgi:predicted DNA-binding transcriptional regulator YafY